MAMFFTERAAARMPRPDEILPGRTQALALEETTHAVLGASLVPPFPAGSAVALFGMGCFWGVERKFWQVPGVVSTHVGYAGGGTPNPTYKEVCTGRTGHNEVVRVVYDPAKVSYDALLRVFWENHDPTQGMRQGNDVGTQYRSGIYVYGAEQRAAAEVSRFAYQAALSAAGHGAITTEIVDAAPAAAAGGAPDTLPRQVVFYYAEDYHQQYLHKNPQGYCGIGGTGVSCPVGKGVSA
jgi:peptide-methionine (S)-S-oxide reductase